MILPPSRDPSYYIDALQDRIHQEVRKPRATKSVKVPLKPKPKT